jgi:hypothetical protein
MMNYTWPMATGVLLFFIFLTAVIVYLAIVLLWSGSKILICDVDAGEPDMTGYEHLSRAEIEKARADPRNLRRRLLDKLFMGVCLGFFPAAIILCCAQFLFGISLLQAFLFAGLPGYLLYIAACVLIIDHTLQGELKFRWRRCA